MDRIFKALGHPVRLKIYRYVLMEPLCVCELTELFTMSQPAISQHLRRLRQVELIQPERRGQWTFYRGEREPLREVLGYLLEDSSTGGEKIDELEQTINRVKQKNLCELRDSRGELPAERTAYRD